MINIEWAYKHFTGTTYVPRVKHGVLVRIVKSRRTSNGNIMAVVKFDGNKTCSRVPLCELTIPKRGEK